MKIYAKKISETGGKQRSRLWEIILEYKVAYCKDPFGNIIGVLGNDFEKNNNDRKANREVQEQYIETIFVFKED